MSIWTGAFWKATTERAIATAAQVAVLVIGADMANVIAVDWAEVGGFAAGGAVLAVLKALAAGAGDGNPSVGNQETLAGRGAYLKGQEHDPNLRA
jgi:hypothetical protein